MKHKKHNGGAISTVIFVLAIVILVGGFGFKKIMEAGTNTANQVTQTVSKTDEVSANQKAFIKQMGAPAVRVWHLNHQALPSIVIAQAILESSWGQSDLYAQANNPFGVKGTYNGASKTFPTAEYIGGKKKMVNAAFRDYPTLREAILDHDNVLQTQFFKQRVTDYKTAVNLLQQNGYATDPNYAKKLTNVIITYDLVKYDEM